MTTLANTPHSGQANVPEHLHTAPPRPTSAQLQLPASNGPTQQAPTEDHGEAHSDASGINTSLQTDSCPRWPTLLYCHTHDLQHHRRVKGITAPFPFMGTPVVLASTEQRQAHPESYELLCGRPTQVGPTDMELVFLVECSTPPSSVADNPDTLPTEPTEPLANGHPCTSNWLPIMTDLSFRGLHSPCVTRIDGRLLVGGTRDRPHGNHQFKLPGLASKPRWRQQMSFYLENRGDSSFSLAFNGPEELCGIRLVQLQDGRILMLHPIVPQSDRRDQPLHAHPLGSLGSGQTSPISPTEAATATQNGLAYRIVDSLDDLSAPDAFTNSRPILWCTQPDASDSRGIVRPAAPVGTDNTMETTGLSPCEVTLLANGCVGILALQRRLDTQGRRHSNALTFCLDPDTGLASAPSPLAKRDDFPANPTAPIDTPPSRRSFQPGGLVRMGDGDAILYASLDEGACSGSITVSDPFNKYEGFAPMLPHQSRASTRG